MNKQSVYDFADAINEANIDKICSLMTEDHTFIDAHGNRVIGREKMKVVVADNKIKLWQAYGDTKIPFDIISRNT